MKTIKAQVSSLSLSTSGLARFGFTDKNEESLSLEARDNIVPGILLFSELKPMKKPSKSLADKWFLISYQIQSIEYIDGSNGEKRYHK